MDDNKEGEELSLINSCESGYSVYKRRWLMLGIYCFHMSTSIFLSIMYAPVPYITAMYYNIEIPTVDAFATVFFIVYIVGIFPIMWLKYKTDLKVIFLIGDACEVLGSFIRFCSTYNHSFLLAITGQTLCGVGMTCTYAMASEFAGTWFGINEVSFASGMGFTAIELGIGATYIIVPAVLHNYQNSEDIMHFFSLVIGTVMLFKLLVTFFVFQAKPPVPPSNAKVKALDSRRDFRTYLKNIMRNKQFILSLITFSILMGFLSVSSVKAPELISGSAKESATNVIGIMKALCGVFGPVCGGYWLDRTKKFRSTTLAIVVLITIFLIGFTFSITYKNSILIFGTLGTFWFLNATFFPVACEQAVELTYPIPEFISSCLLNVFAMTFSLICIVVLDVVIYLTNNSTALAIVCVVHLISVTCAYAIKSENRRQHADKNEECYEESEVQETELK